MLQKKIKMFFHVKIRSWHAENPPNTFIFTVILKVCYVDHKRIIVLKVQPVHHQVCVFNIFLKSCTGHLFSTVI